MKDNFGTAVSSDPAANTEHSITISASDGPIILVGFSAALVTDANAANRQVKFSFEDASGRVFQYAVAGGTHAASLTRQYAGRCTGYASPAVADTLFVVSLPEEGIWIPAGGVIKTITTNLQATDNWGALTYQFKRPE
jgi:hypothetical protein